MTTPTTKAISTTLILNEDNASTARLQVCSRAAGRVPTDFLGTQTVSLERLNQALAPLERTACLYRTADASTTAIFIRLLASAKLEREKQTRVLGLKDQLIRLFNRYANTDPQSNILKLLSLRFFANINRLLKVPVLKECHIRSNKNTSTTLRRTSSGSLLDELKLAVQGVSAYIFLLELEVESEEHKWPSLAPIQLCQQLITPLLEVVSDLQMKSCIRELENDLDLLEGLTLAPQLLLPLAIMPFGDFARTSSVAFQEIGEMLKERLALISHITTDIQTQGKKELNSLCRTFLHNYQPGMQKLFQAIQQVFQQAYTLQGSRAIDHLLACQTLLAQLKRPHALDNQPPLTELIALGHKLSSVKAKDQAQRIIDKYILPMHTVTSRYQLYLKRLLVEDLENFSQAYASYLQLIPAKQREMQTDLYTPYILLIWNIVDPLHSLVEKINENVHFTKLLNIIILINEVELNASQWYYTSFPHFTDAHEKTLKTLQDAQKQIQTAQNEFREHAVLSTEDLAYLEHAGKVLDCFYQFLDSSASYPFLFTPLGSGTLQDNSYEHELTTKIAFCLYKNMRGFKKTYAVSHITFRVSEENEIPPQNATRYVLKPSFDLFCIWTAYKLQHDWQEIERIDPSTFITHYPSLARSISHFREIQKNIALCQLEDQLILSLDKRIENGFLKPYHLITRYFNLLTLPTQVFSSAHSTHHIQKKGKKTSRLLPQPAPNKPERKPRLSHLDSCMQAIRESLTLPTASSQVESLDAMRDCYHQITCHLDALKNLFPLLKRKESLSFYQLQTLLIHQASAIEQAVKLAALARPKVEAKAKELQGLLKSTHQPSQFFERFLPCQSNIAETRWQSAHTIACAVDDFLAVPARYAVGLHAWMNLLNEWWDSLDPSPQGAKAKYQEIKALIKDNAKALATLLEDASHSLPIPQQTSFTPSLLDGTIQGLAERECFKIPQQAQTPFADFDSLEDSIYQLESIQRVSSLSRYETTSDLISRRKYLHRSLHILSVNSLKIRDLLEEGNPAAWCSSYTSTLLLSGAVCLEQSIQALLFWLPVSSQGQSDIHYLLSHRPGANGRSVPLWQTHSIQDNADRAIEGLREAGKTALAERLQKIRDQLSWIEPLIKQLYRYPFSVTDNRSADILRLFHALASIRKAIHEEALGEGSRRVLLEALSPQDPEVDLLTAFDALIEAHIQHQVAIPTYDFLQASFDVLSILQELTATL